MLCQMVDLRRACIPRFGGDLRIKSVIGEGLGCSLGCRIASAQHLGVQDLRVLVSATLAIWVAGTPLAV
jgi:hypothetical protein